MRDITVNNKLTSKVQLSVISCLQIQIDKLKIMTGLLIGAIQPLVALEATPGALPVLAKVRANKGIELEIDQNIKSTKSYFKIY